MPDELPENLGPDGTPYEAAGGEALRRGEKPGWLSRAGSSIKNRFTNKSKGGAPDATKKPPGIKGGATDIAKNQGAEALGTAAAAAVTGGSGGIGAVLGPIIKKATEFVVKKLLSKDWWKVVLMAFWPQLAAGVIITLFIVIAVVLVSRAGKGPWGRSAAQDSSLYSNSDINDIQVILGKSFQLSGNPKDWYFSQNDLQWADYTPKGFSKNMDKSGCVVSSWAMIAKYYGVYTNPKKILVDSGCSGTDHGCIKQYVINAINLSGSNKIWKSINPSDTASIQKQLEKGNPIVIYAQNLSGASNMHAAVIIGFSPEQSKILLNDPEFGSMKKSTYNPGSVKFLSVIDDK